MNIFLTGGSGFIGSHLCDYLLKEGNNVTILSRSGEFHHNFFKKNNSKVNWILGNFEKIDDFKKIIPINTDIILHLATTTFPNNVDFIKDTTSNIIPSIKLMECVKEMKIKKFIFLSSGGAVYGNPLLMPILESVPTNPVSSYGIQKLTIEKYALLFFGNSSTHLSIMRVSNPFGLGQMNDKGVGVISSFIKKIHQNEPIEVWGDGLIVKDYLYIDDLISAIMKLIDYNGQEMIFNVGSGIGKTIIEVANSISIHFKKEVDITFINQKSFDVNKNVLSIEKIKSELGWNPNTLFETGLGFMINQYIKEVEK